MSDGGGPGGGLYPLGGAAAKPSKIQVGFVTNNPHEFWTIAEAGTRSGPGVRRRGPFPPAAKKARPPPERDHRRPGGASGRRRRRQPYIDPKTSGPYFERIAGSAPLITRRTTPDLDDDPNTKRLCYIGTDNYKAARPWASWWKGQCPRGAYRHPSSARSKPLNAQQRAGRAVLDTWGQEGHHGGQIRQVPAARQRAQLRPFTDTPTAAGRVRTPRTPTDLRQNKTFA